MFNILLFFLCVYSMYIAEITVNNNNHGRNLRGAGGRSDQCSVKD